jgi:hypothetical protein
MIVKKQRAFATMALPPPPTDHLLITWSAMSDTTQAVLLGLFILAWSTWLGGFVAIGVVARVASRTLSRGDRIAFFRALGRSYGVVGSVALLLAYGTGGALLSQHSWDGTALAAVMIAAVLVAATVVGVVQARRMTRLRQRALTEPDGAALANLVERGARRAAVLRAGIGLLSLALVAVMALLGGTP